MTLVGVNPNCIIIPSNPFPDYFNYFTAYTPATGIKNIRQFKNITYKNIYPGIDLEFVTNEEHGYKYNFIIWPEGKISSVKLKISDSSMVTLENDSLIFHTMFGNLFELIPESYREVNHNKVKVKCRFIKINDGIYGFSVDDTILKNSELIIDPTSIRLWGTYYGGNNSEWGAHGCTDNFSNVFIAGRTESDNNIATAGSYQSTRAGAGDGYLAKFNAAGQRQWGTYFGGSNYEYVNSCNSDRTGNVYIEGYTSSTLGIASVGAHQTIYGGGPSDCYIEKFNQFGDRVWGTYYGGVFDDWDGYCTVDKTGNVFLTGTTSSLTGIATVGSYQPNNNGSQDAFLAKFDSNGVRQWGTYYGGESTESGYACATDSIGNVYFGGITNSLLNIASTDGYQKVYGGGLSDGFVAKFNTIGQRLWATYYGGTGADCVTECKSDSTGNLIFVGYTTSSTGIASSGCHQPALGGGTDGYLTKFDTSGQRLWGTYYGGINQDDGYSCAIGSNGVIFFSGYTESPNNIATLNSYQPSYAGSGDTFIIKFNTNGQRQWGSYFGGSNSDYSYWVGYLPDDTLYIAGGTLSLNNISTPGAHQEVYGGNKDDMLIKFLDCWPIDTAGPISGPVIGCELSTGVNYSIPPLAHAINYIWTLPPGFTISAGAETHSITVDISTSANSGNIWVKGLNKCGDSGDSAFLYVTVNPRPVPVITGPNSTCAGTGKVYSTASGMTNYQWSTSAGGVITIGGTISDNTATVTWTGAGNQTISVNYTDANGCEGLAPTVYNVTVDPSPAVGVTISTPSNIVCSGTQVTFNAVPSNEGSTPFYQWKVNGLNVGTSGTSYSYIPLNGDVVTCVLTSSITGCIQNNPATSNTITMVVNPNLPVSVSVSPSTNPVCSGTTVTFTATPTHGGTTPTFQWKVNGSIVGSNSNTYSYIPLNNDVITCKLTSSETCTTENPAISNPVTMTVNPNLSVSVSISASSNPFCIGGSVNFTATPTHGGVTPSYQWKVNGLNAGTNNSIYTYNPVSSDVVTCILTSSYLCVTGNPATSNTITMIGNLGLPAGVSITASLNPFCPGTSVNFTATPNNGGANPVYQWKVNGLNAGANSSNYSYNPLTGDKVTCVMTSNLACVSGNP
ncbi:MAG: hypothetical protein WCL00_02465, partial [Bacteroidota bacterium]